MCRVIERAHSVIEKPVSELCTWWFNSGTILSPHIFSRMVAQVLQVLECRDRDLASLTLTLKQTLDLKIPLSLKAPAVLSPQICWTAPKKMKSWFLDSTSVVKQTYTHTSQTPPLSFDFFTDATSAVNDSGFFVSSMEWVVWISSPWSSTSSIPPPIYQQALGCGGIGRRVSLPPDGPLLEKVAPSSWLKPLILCQEFTHLNLRTLSGLKHFAVWQKKFRVEFLCSEINHIFPHHHESCFLQTALSVSFCFPRAHKSWSTLIRRWKGGCESEMREMMKLK